VSQPNFTKDPKKDKNYIQAPRSFEIHQSSTTSSPAAAANEDDENHHELEESHRALALEGVEKDEALGCGPSTGDAPQPHQLLDLSSPTTTRAATGRPTQIQPTTIRHPNTLLRTLG